MLLRLAVVVYSHEKDVAGVFGYFCGIFLALYLVDGCVDGVVELQLYDQCRFIDVAAGNHHEVGIALASGIFAVDDILVSCPYIGYGEHASQRVLVVVGQDARVLVVGEVNGLGNGCLVSCYGGVDKWNERRLVNILVGDYVPKLTVASVYICSHNIIEPVAGEISLRFGAKLQQIRYLSKLFATFHIFVPDICKSPQHDWATEPK